MKYKIDVVAVVGFFTRHEEYIPCHAYRKINILSGALKQDLKYFLFSWAGMKSPGEANHILDLKISTRKRNLRSLET